MLVIGIRGPREDALLDERPEPVSEDVGGDALFRPRQEVTEVSPVAKDDVANDQQTPFVADHFQRQIDRASRPWSRMHSPLPREKPVALSH
jgi:hypothetical protein